MTANDGHEKELEELMMRVDAIEETAPMWTQPHLQKVRAVIMEARKTHREMNEYA